MEKGMDSQIGLHQQMVQSPKSKRDNSTGYAIKVERGDSHKKMKEKVSLQCTKL